MLVCSTVSITEALREKRATGLQTHRGVTLHPKASSETSSQSLSSSSNAFYWTPDDVLQRRFFIVPALPTFAMKTPVLMPMLFPLVVLLSCCGPSLGYSTGPPTSACTDMYPAGHNADAQTTTLPFELLVSNTTFTPNAKIVVTLQVKSSMSTMFFKGMFVQARLAGNCSNTSPVGTFSVPTGDTYLQLGPCSQSNSSISHKNSLVEIHSKNFTWTAPSTTTGRIFFRATVVKSRQEFWTNVFSSYVKPVSDTSSPPTTACEVRKTFVQTSTPASSSYKTSSTVSSSTKVSSTVSSSTKVSSTLTTRTTARLTTKRTTSLYTSGTSIISPARLLAAVACVIALAARV